MKAIPVYDMLTRLREILRMLQSTVDDLQSALDSDESDRRQEVDSDARD